MCSLYRIVCVFRAISRQYTHAVGASETGREGVIQGQRESERLYENIECVTGIVDVREMKREAVCDLC